MEDLFYEVFTDLPRQGPGDDESTQKAASMVPEIPKYPKILDVGCGTGRQTLELAKYFGGTIYAVDNHQPYLDSLCSEARLKGFGEIIKCINTNMREPDFINGKFDLIWAEGSIYVVGFKEGLSAFKKMLNPTGYIAVSEVCWLKENPPDDLLEFWEREYPAIRDIEYNIEVIDSLGYRRIGYFVLPEKAWRANFYEPLGKRLKKLYVKYHENEVAHELLDLVKLEIEMYEKYYDYYGYVFFIMQNQKN